MVTPTYKRNMLERNTNIRHRNTCFLTFSVDCFFLFVTYNALTGLHVFFQICNSVNTLNSQLYVFLKTQQLSNSRYNQSFTHTEKQSEIKLLFLSLIVFTSYPFPLTAVYENHDKLLAIVPLSLHDQTAICS